MCTFGSAIKLGINQGQISAGVFKNMYTGICIAALIILVKKIHIINRTLVKINYGTP